MLYNTVNLYQYLYRKQSHQVPTNTNTHMASLTPIVRNDLVISAVIQSSRAVFSERTMLLQQGQLTTRPKERTHQYSQALNT